MIRLTNLLLELLLEKLPDGVLRHRIPNPREDETGHADISIGWALKFPQNDPAYIAAKDYLMRFKDDDKSGASSSGSPTDTQQTTQPSSGKASAKLAAVARQSAVRSAAEGGKVLAGMISAGSNVTITAAGKDLKSSEVLDALNDPSSPAAQSLQKELDRTTYNSGLTISGLASAVTALSTTIASSNKNIEVAMDDRDNMVLVKITPIGWYSRQQIKGQFEFNLDPKKNTVYADLVIMDDKNCPQCGKDKKDCTCSNKESSGLRPKAPTILRTAIDAADAAGINNISFLAALEAGAYQWAKMGGAPKDGSYTGSVKARIVERADTIREMARHDTSQFNKVDRDNFIDSNTTQLTYDDKLNKKLTGKAIRDIERMKQQGEFDTLMELLDVCVNELETDPTTLTTIANHDLGRYLLQGTMWKGKFDITPDSESRDFILQNL